MNRTQAVKRQAAAKQRAAERIRAHRIQAGLTQADVDRAIRSASGRCREWETGIHAPSLDSLSRLARALSVPLESFTCEDGFVPLATFVLSPESVAELTSPATRTQALERIHKAMSAQLLIELEKAQPLKPFTGRAKRRRSREELLLAQAERFRLLNEATRVKRRTVE